MTIGVALGWTGITKIIGLAVIGPMWFILTIFILCIMEVSACLGFPGGWRAEKSS